MLVECADLLRSQCHTAHAHFASDAAALRDLKGRLGSFDFAEPFARIREAVSEARTTGFSRAA